jgi:hypothetical protein
MEVVILTPNYRPDLELLACDRICPGRGGSEESTRPIQDVIWLMPKLGPRMWSRPQRYSHVTMVEIWAHD